MSLIKLENKTLSEELQDYKVKIVIETKRLQDFVWREVLGLQSLSKGKGESYLLSGVGTWELEP